MLVFISGWMLFCIAVAVLLLTALVMQFFGGFFITKDVLVRNFTILDLEMASTEMEIDNTLKGIIKLEPPAVEKVIKSLKNHLYADFLFMPAAYGTIFIACMKVAWKMPEPGVIFFTLLGWIQIAAWISDIMENIYLLGKIGRLNSVYKPSYLSFHAYQVLEIVKWGFSLLAVVCVLSALMYFWISGLYMGQSLKYLLIVVIEIVVFGGLMKVFKNPGKTWKTAMHY
ncbi:MAG: hypothetical protein H0X41_12615 [Chitinophagaceae bacterium]|nr:hypothetical protein [Chitinophagaceae bacterium]